MKKNKKKGNGNANNKTKKKNTKNKKKKQKQKQKRAQTVPRPGSSAQTYDYSDLFGDTMTIGAIKTPPMKPTPIRTTPPSLNVDTNSIFNLEDLGMIGKVTSTPPATSQYTDVAALGGLVK